MAVHVLLTALASLSHLLAILLLGVLALAQLAILELFFSPFPPLRLSMSWSRSGLNTRGTMRGSYYVYFVLRAFHCDPPGLAPGLQLLCSQLRTRSRKPMF